MSQRFNKYKKPILEEEEEFTTSKKPLDSEYDESLNDLANAVS